MYTKTKLNLQPGPFCHCPEDRQGDLPRPAPPLDFLHQFSNLATGAVQVCDTIRQVPRVHPPHPHSGQDACSIISHLAVGGVGEPASGENAHIILVNSWMNSMAAK
jgi:hypothetical protein